MALSPRLRLPRLLSAATLGCALFAAAAVAEAAITVSTVVTRNIPSRTSAYNPLWINYSDCQQDAQINFTLTMSEEWKSTTLEVWASTGVDCTDVAQRTGASPGCWNVFKEAPTTGTSYPVKLLAQDLIGQHKNTEANHGPGTGTIADCDAAATSAPQQLSLFFILVDGSGQTVSSSAPYTSMSYDLLGPDAPTDVSVGVGDTRLVLDWENPNSPDLAGFEFYCDPAPGGASAPGGSAGAASGGSAGAASGGSAGQGGAAGGAGGGPGGAIVPYDAQLHPVRDLFRAYDLPIAIAADNVTVFHAKRGGAAGVISATPLDGSATMPITGTDVNRPMALAAPAVSLNVFYVGGSSGIGELGRYLKAPGGDPNPRVPIDAGSGASAIEQAVAIAIGTDGYAYVSARAIAPNHPTVLRFQLQASGDTADTLYTTQTGNDSGGPITASKGCVYFISSGDIFVIPSEGALFRKPALATPITDAIGLASDQANLYFTRARGEVWQRKLSPSPACDNSGPAEKLLATGFTGIGAVIAYEPSTVAWSAKGDPSKSFAGGGVFTTPADGYTVTQLAPETDGVEQLADAGSYVAYATANGYLRRVTK